MVVSEMKLRLSPKYAPPTTMATIMAVLVSVCSAIRPAMGTRAAMVPTLVPVLREMKQAATKRLLSRKSGGTAVRASRMVASMAPICLAVEAKAPARMNIQSICITLDEAAPCDKCPKRSPMVCPRTMNRL